MRPSEKKLIRHYYARTTNSEEKLRLNLFNLLDRGNVSADSEVLIKLGNHKGGSSYSHLKSRLKKDILNVLLMQDANKRLGQANRVAELEGRKSVAQSHLLIFRGAQEEGMRVLKKALQTADRYELLAERLQIHHLLREFSISTAPATELERLNKEISRDLKRYEDLLYVEEKSVVLSSPEMGKKLRSKGNELKYVELINSLDKLYKKHRLARMGFWYYLAATEYNTTRGNYELVVELGLKFLKLVETKPAVRSKNNMAGVNQTVGFAQMQLHRFKDATSHFAKSEKLFPQAGFNRLQCLQFLVQSELAQHDYCKVLSTIDRAMAHPRIGAREYLKPRWLYIQACAQFLSQDVAASFKTLNSNVYLLKQQDDWNIQFRLLEMFQLIEMGDEEWLEFKLDTTKKFLTRHKKLESLRIRTAIDVISNLLRKELNFSELSEKNLAAIQACINESKGYEWNPAGPEIVRFDKWIESKRSN